MKALSILQPWAWLIVHGYKDVENRTWRSGYRGPLLIHAGKTYTRADHADAVVTMQRVFGIVLPMYEAIPRGGIVGSASITACVSASESPWFSGPWGFVMEDRKALPFVPWRGELGFFNVPDDALAGAVHSADTSNTPGGPDRG